MTWRGAGAQRLHDGDGVEALLEVGAHGHGDADGSEDEGYEGHEREEAGGAVEALGEGGVGLAVVDDLGFRQELFEAQLQVGYGGVVDGAVGAGLGHLEEEALAGVGAGGEEAGAVEACAGDEDAGAGGEVGGEAVGLVGDGGGDGEESVAELELVAAFEVEAEEEVVADGYGVGVEGLGEGLGGVEVDGAVEGEFGGVDGFDGDEEGVHGDGDGGHGEELGDGGDLDVIALDLEEADGFVGGGLAGGAGGQVSGQDRPGVGEEGGSEGAGEAADAGEGGYADGDGEDDEEEFAAGGVHLAVGDLGGGLVGEGGHGS